MNSSRAVFQLNNRLYLLLNVCLCVCVCIMCVCIVFVLFLREEGKLYLKLIDHIVAIIWALWIFYRNTLLKSALKLLVRAYGTMLLEYLL